MVRVSKEKNTIGNALVSLIGYFQKGQAFTEDFREFVKASSPPAPLRTNVYCNLLNMILFYIHAYEIRLLLLLNHLRPATEVN